MRLLLALSLLAALPAAAQDTDSELWLTANAKAGIGEKTDLAIETIGRFSDRDGFYEFEAGAAIEHEIAKGVKIAAGHFYVPGYDHGRFRYGEQRPRQQISFPIAAIAGGKLGGRVRTEQRFRTDGDDVGLRFRPQLNFEIPLGSGDAAPSLTLWHESYVNLNDTDWGQKAGYERMRNALAVAVPLSGPLGIEAGYLNQYRFAQGLGRDQMDNVATLTLSLDF